MIVVVIVYQALGFLPAMLALPLTLVWVTTKALGRLFVHGFARVVQPGPLLWRLALRLYLV